MAEDLKSLRKQYNDVNQKYQRSWRNDVLLRDHRDDHQGKMLALIVEHGLCNEETVVAVSNYRDAENALRKGEAATALVLAQRDAIFQEIAAAEKTK